MVSKVAIFGGTGMTGSCVVEYALQKGLSVRLLYRTEETVEPFKNRDKVELIKGDVTNVQDVENVLTGTDGVVVTLGTRNKLEPTTVLSTGLTNIVNAMEKVKLRKISVCLSSFLFWDQDKVPKQFEHLNAEHKRMLDIIKATSLDYIAILPPHIANEPSSEHKILHDQSPGRVISKFDLAKFFIDSLDLSEHYGKVCGIAKV
ncbi:flavin reductase (NADPH) [Sitodiplosis mosellana]|uniref:flavin reductase (NADPH) n=1 Tax=Sitodiplosis mosellana TaxID=263140 RepID=UPI0024448049|nr:flavin reductase (NADPH) [Sitodiplosis mosellana]